MGHRRESEPAGRGDTQNRTRIAMLAARLIAEHGLTDWSHAKRKAARQLMLPERTSLPADDEVEAALASHHALFGGDEHAQTLRRQRAEALRWLRDLAPFEPRLVGGVAAGWATAHSDIRIELVADDSKAVELALINRGVAYRVAPMTSQHAAPALHIDTPCGGVRLVVRTRFAARQRPHRDEPRLDAQAVEEMLRDEGQPPFNHPAASSA